MKQYAIFLMQRGQAQPHVYPDDLKDLLIAIPPLAEQKKIIAKIEPLEKEITEAKIFLSNAKSFKQDILDKYLK